MKAKNEIGSVVAATFINLPSFFVQTLDVRYGKLTPVLSRVLTSNMAKLTRYIKRVLCWSKTRKKGQTLGKL